MQNPLVSIITPCYNSSKYIAETIKSVQNQTYQNWEMLITDDGSKDDSVSIIREFIKQDSRIKLFEISNSGAAVARNNSIKEARGTYIAFLDSDDLWLEAKLEKQTNYMETNNYLLSYTSYEKIDEKSNLLNQVIKAKSKVNYQTMLTSNKIGCLTAVYNQKELGKVYMPLIRKRQDYALWLKILKQVDFAYGIDEVLAKYRIHDLSISSKKTEMIKWNWKLYREIEEKSMIHAFFLIICNVFSKIRNL